MNTYNLFPEKEPGTILYHAIAENEEQVKNLASVRNINIDGLKIDLEKSNVKPQFGGEYIPVIKDALIY